MNVRVNFVSFLLIVETSTNRDGFDGTLQKLNSADGELARLDGVTVGLFYSRHPGYEVEYFV